MLKLTPEQIIGYSFLLPPDENKEKFQPKMLSQIAKKNGKLETRPELIKLNCIIHNDKHDVVGYNQVVDFIKDDQTLGGVWKYKAILDHQGPRKYGDPRCKGSS